MWIHWSLVGLLFQLISWGVGGEYFAKIESYWPDQPAGSCLIDTAICWPVCTVHQSALPCIAPYFTVLHHITLYFTVLHCITLYFTVFHWFPYNFLKKVFPFCGSISPFWWLHKRYSLLTAFNARKIRTSIVALLLSGVVEMIALYNVKSIITSFSASRQDKRVL